MLRLKRFSPLRPLELFITEHNFICLNRHQSFFIFAPAFPYAVPQHRTGLTCSALGLRAAEQEEQEAESGRGPHGKGLSVNQPGDTHGEGHRLTQARRTGRGRCPSGGTASAAGPPQHSPAGRAVRAVRAGLRHSPAAIPAGGPGCPGAGGKEGEGGGRLWRRCRDSAGAGRRAGL